MQETVPTPFDDLKMFIALHAVPYLQFQANCSFTVFLFSASLKNSSHVLWTRKGEKVKPLLHSLLLQQHPDPSGAHNILCPVSRAFWSSVTYNLHFVQDCFTCSKKFVEWKLISENKLDNGPISLILHQDIVLFCPYLPQCE